MFLCFPDEWQCALKVVWLALLCLVLLSIVTSVIGQIYKKRRLCSKRQKTIKQKKSLVLWCHNWRNKVKILSYYFKFLIKNEKLWVFELSLSISELKVWTYEYKKGLALFFSGGNRRPKTCFFPLPGKPKVHPDGFNLITQQLNGKPAKCVF